MAEFYQETPEFNFKKIAPAAIVIGALVLILISWSSITVRIDSGHAGVKYRMLSGTDLEQVYSEGLKIKAPWDKIEVYEVRQQEVTEKMAVLSSNGLEITVELSAWYQPFYGQLPQLHQEKGKDYLNVVVRPAIRSATRSVIGRYTPDELYASKRDAIQSEIYEETKKILDNQFVQLNEILVRDVMLPATIKAAIENKLKQEQAALEYEFKLSKAKKEAERQKIEAEGKAAANDIISKSLTDKILREKGIIATLKLAESPNAKVVVVGSGKDGLPLILNSDK
jgi:regulator of protease activity HflC (stomatin/prohibitin superfamily)